MKYVPPFEQTQDNHRERLSLIVNAIGIGVWDWQIQADKLIYNNHLAHMLGYDEREILPLAQSVWSQLVHPDDFVAAKESLMNHFNGLSEVYEVELRMRHKSGNYIWALASGRVVEWQGGQAKRMIGMHLDINERKINEESLVVTSQLLNQSQQVARVGGWQLELSSGKLFWTEETYRIHDTSPEEFDPTVDAGVSYFLPDSQTRISSALDDAINNGVGYDLELQTYTTKGRIIDVRTTCVVTQENGISVRLTGIFQDITEQKTIQRKLENTNDELAVVNAALKQSAHYDSLTHLPNRYLLADRMQQGVVKCTRSNNFLAIAFIDIDGFKWVNDNHGHDVGDELLKKLAEVLKSSLREGDTLARIGGDEFVAVIDNLLEPSEGERVLSRMLEAASSPIIVDERILNVSASIGVTVYPLDQSDPDQLLRHADQAMYIAKQNGKNCYHIFDIEKDVATKHHNEKLTRIGQALKDDEFVLYYQPKVDLKKHELVGLEALIRWNDPDKGIRPPADFLPEVETNILGIEIGKWVIQTALKQLDEWRKVDDDITISVNISPLHLQQPNFVSELKTYLDLYPNYKAESLDLEIVESSALNDIELVSSIIKECKQIGVSFSIDDFGVGYSSLVYLKRLPVKYLKIDQSFVRDMLFDMDDKAIIQGIIELAKVFNLTVIAEGVETNQHGDVLLALGCLFAQGYGIARPMPSRDFLPWLRAFNSATN
jgi:diguanylate cyclase (GGDEF)-like protein/PAS domain S-box-containing protein